MPLRGMLCLSVCVPRPPVRGVRRNTTTTILEEEEEESRLAGWDRVRRMSAICFVCNLPILSHQVGLVWEGGNGWDELQSENTSPRAPRVGRRDSSAQITTIEPPREVRETSPPTSRRRRSSLAQLTDILREWGRRDTTTEQHRSMSTTTAPSAPGLSRRESLADIAKSLPWGKRDSVVEVPRMKARRESSAEIKKRRQSGTDIRNDIAKFLARRESVAELLRRRRDSLEQERKERRDSTTQVYSRNSRSGLDKIVSPDRPTGIVTQGVSCGTSGGPEVYTHLVSSPEPRELTPRPIVTTQASSESHLSQCSLVSQISGAGLDGPESIAGPSFTEPRSPVSSPAPSSPTPSAARRDSTTQIYRGRRDSRPQVSPERGSARGSREPSPKYRSLRRQSTAIEELPLPGSRRGSRPFLSPDANEADCLNRKCRRDSLSPDSAATEELPQARKGRRDSRPHLSPEASDSNSRETSPRSHLRRQSTTATEYIGRGRRSSRSPRSPDSSSTCSSRDPSPKERRLIRRQSTTEEILRATGFRRQSTTEDMMRARNFRRQSTQSEEMSKSRGRRDSCAQITDGTIATMTIETSSAFFDTSTQTGAFLAGGNHMHNQIISKIVQTYPHCSDTFLDACETSNTTQT
ncbi:uncharacterized protein LOC143030079 [Oratosquilla oratoria]|uniref:uncharacterized protein LOC143030079 n=1 Tax=Oratosquilla oratoria TaxID=337810 RepID=UPI003F760473